MTKNKLRQMRYTELAKQHECLVKRKKCNKHGQLGYSENNAGVDEKKTTPENMKQIKRLDD